jgi:hypothetical protein
MRTNPEEQFPRNSCPPPEIPPLPEMAGALPLPKPRVATTSGKKTVLMALGAMVVVLIGAVVAGVGLFWVTILSHARSCDNPKFVAADGQACAGNS